MYFHYRPKAQPYDALGRTVSTVAPDGASTTTYQYQGNVATVTDPAGKQKTHTMYAFNELIQVTEPRPNPGTEPTHQTYYTYDLLGHLTQVSMPRTVSGTVVTQTRSWAYSSTTELLAPHFTRPQTLPGPAISTAPLIYIGQVGGGWAAMAARSWLAMVSRSWIVVSPMIGLGTLGAAPVSAYWTST